MSQEEEKKELDMDDLDVLGDMPEEMLTSKSVPIRLKRDELVSTDVYPWMEITVTEIDIVRQMWTASVEIHLFWQDFSLPLIHPNYSEVDFILDEDDVPIKLTEIWENKFNEQIQSIDYEFLPETSVVYMSIIMQVTFVERMELQRFPVDRQFLGMDFNAWTTQGNWNWITKAQDWVPSEFHKQFAVRMVSSIQEYVTLDPWIDFTSDQPPLSIRLRVERLPSYYFGSIILPNFLIVCAAFAAFPIQIDDEESSVADRLSVTVTLMLTAVAFRFVVTDSLPKVTYLTFMDYYLLEGFIILVILIFENAFTGMTNFDIGLRKQVDNASLIAIVLIWLATHAVAVTCFLNDNFMRVPWEKMDELDSDDSDEFRYSAKTMGMPQSVECIEEWKKFKGQPPEIRASQWAEKHPDLARTNTGIQEETS